jgi:hypothetical protein
MPMTERADELLATLDAADDYQPQAKLRRQ